MSLTIGIAGLPNVGRSALSDTLTHVTVPATNYPFATIEPNAGTVPLPDPHLEVLTEMLHSKKVIPVTASFMDITDIMRGTSGDEGPGNQSLANIRETDTICQVTRASSDPDVVHVGSRVSPVSDIGTIQIELILAGMQAFGRQTPRLKKEVRDKKTEPIALETAKETLILLGKGRLLLGPVGVALDQDALKSFQLMTTKPFISVFNVDQAGTEDEALQQSLHNLVAPTEVIFLDAQFEPEFVELNEEDTREMLENSGQTEAGLDKLARVGFATLGLQAYLTAGPKEAHAWTIHRGDTAPQAAGIIHTNLQRGLIKAKIVPYDDLARLGSMQEAHAVGKVRMEGRDYVMADGDVVEFKFNI